MVVELNIGQVVISRKGKDKGRLYIVTGFSEDCRYAFIAEGLKFTFSFPKKKNRIHLQAVNVSISLPENLDELENNDITREIDNIIRDTLDNLRKTRRLNRPYGQQG